MENIATCVRISCFGYSKNIPFELNYEDFVKTFMKKFEVNESEIKGIYFEIYFYNGMSSLNYKLKNQNDYYEAFISNECLRLQFFEISGKAIFPGSDIKKKRQSDPLKIDFLNSQNIIKFKSNNKNKNNNNNNNNEEDNQNFKFEDRENFYDINNIDSGGYYNQDNYNNKNNNKNRKGINEFNINPINDNEKKNRFNANNNNQNNIEINDNQKKNRFNKITNQQNNNNQQLNQENKKINKQIKNENIIQNNQFYNKNNQNNNFDNFLSICEQEKRKKIEKLQKEIKELKLIYQIEKNKYEEYKKLDINKNNGLVQINETQKNRKNKVIHINQSLQIIPDFIKVKKSNLKKSNVNAIFINENNNENIITKEKLEIEQLNSIKYKFKLLRKNINEYWPKNIFLFCVPDDSDIYFKHVKLNDSEKVKSYKMNNSICYEIIIDIKFKNIRNINYGDYIVNAKLISDSNLILNKSVWQIIVRIIDKNYYNFSIFI